MSTNMFHDWYRHSIKKKIIIRSIEQSMLWLNINCTTSTKATTHYETLGISPNATFNQIKSAYYKLTLQYHPDKNKSKYAKKKFHEISNAYDILSKYESRKQYDRTILARSKSLNFVKQKTIPRSNTQYNQDPNTMYNFDQWVKMHYSIAFMQNIEKKQTKKDTQKEKDDAYYEALDAKAMGTIIAIFSFLICIKILVDSKRSERKNHKP